MGEAIATSFAPPRLVIIGATGWYGRTLVHEYVQSYGGKAAIDNLLLYASRTTQLSIEIEDLSLNLEVSALTEASNRSLEEFDGLVWYSFILKNKIPIIGAEAYRIANDAIADHVFSCLDNNPHLRTTFFSSGSAYGLSECPSYENDPYAYLKIVYEHKLSQHCKLITMYPYATIGKFVADYRSFAVASFIHQALKTGSIQIEADRSVVRSYGSVHDFSKLLLRLYELSDWGLDGGVPAKIFPVTHTLDLIQLAHEVAAALERDIHISNSVKIGNPPSIYATSILSYAAQLAQFGLMPTTLREQLRDMSKGLIFQGADINVTSDIAKAG